MEIEKILKNLVRIGTITVTDPDKRVARVKFEDTGRPSGWLYVLANRPYMCHIISRTTTHRSRQRPGRAARVIHSLRAIPTI